MYVPFGLHLVPMAHWPMTETVRAICSVLLVYTYVLGPPPPQVIPVLLPSPEKGMHSIALSMVNRQMTL